MTISISNSQGQAKIVFKVFQRMTYLPYPVPSM